MESLRGEPIPTTKFYLIGGLIGVAVTVVFTKLYERITKKKLLSASDDCGEYSDPSCMDETEPYTNFELDLVGAMMDGVQEACKFNYDPRQCNFIWKDKRFELAAKLPCVVRKRPQDKDYVLNKLVDDVVGPCRPIDTRGEFARLEKDIKFRIRGKLAKVFDSPTPIEPAARYKKSRLEDDPISHLLRMYRNW